MSKHGRTMVVHHCRPAERVLPHDMRRSNRSPSLARVAIAAALAMTACCGPRPLGLASGQRPPVQPSMAWGATVPPAQVQPRLSALSAAVGRLRRTTGTGWVGRQDDVTGFLAALSGGSFPRPQFPANGQPSPTPSASDPVAAAGSMFASFGRDLFGIDAEQLRVSATDGPDPSDRTRSVTLRVQQQVGDIPVLDGRLAVTVSSAGSAAVTAVAGRVFPGLAAPRSPAVTEAAAARIAAMQGGGTPASPGRLVIVPAASGIQAWEIVVFSSRAEAPTTELVYVDAASGRVVEVRPDSTEDVAPLSVRSVHGVSTKAAAAIGTAGVQGETVDITGADALGNELKAKGLRTSDGTIVLVDTTLPAVSAAGETGDIETHDASSGGRLPGPLVTSGSTRIRDPDAIAAQTLSRYIADYYRNVFGRNSWDGRSGAFVSSVHYGPPTFCNSQFSPSLRQMIYGNACMVNGVPQEVTEVEIDTAAHEITHGVTATTAGLNYTGQSGAMNEGFSDYFGNVIGDAFHGRDSNGVFEGSCHGVVRQTLLCNRNPDGTYSLRYLPNGAKLSDYLDLLDAPAVTGIRQDHGGVHSNSAVWNNVLWSIRLDLARIDGKSMLDSPRAHGFDRIV